MSTPSSFAILERTMGLLAAFIAISNSKLKKAKALLNLAFQELYSVRSTFNITTYSL